MHTHTHTEDNLVISTLGVSGRIPEGREEKWVIQEGKSLASP